MKTRLKWWTYLIVLLPMTFGIWLISKLSLETQIERFNKDPFGNILAGLIIFVVFFGCPLVFSQFFKTVKIVDNKILLVHYPFRLHTKNYQIQNIIKIKDIEQIYGFGSTMNGMEITFKNSITFSFDSRFMTNYYEIEKIIKKETLSINLH